ncbi:hypothetical protein LLG95_15180 [bacterium]|nr:hypothetical protein [bacterium]
MKLMKYHLALNAGLRFWLNAEPRQGRYNLAQGVSPGKSGFIVGASPGRGDRIARVSCYVSALMIGWRHA